MPKVSIDYLNARRDTAQRKGKTIFAPDTNAVDLRAALKAMCPLERAILESDHLFGEFSRWFDELQPVADLLAGKQASHGALLAPGESADDLVF